MLNSIIRRRYNVFFLYYCRRICELVEIKYFHKQKDKCTDTERNCEAENMYVEDRYTSPQQNRRNHNPNNHTPNYYPDEFLETFVKCLAGY